MGKKKLIIIIILVVVLVLGAAAAWLFVSGNLANIGRGATVNTESQTATLNRVCDSTVVTTYNKVMNYQDQTGSNDSSLDEPAIKRLQDDVKGKAGYENDPTCQTILFWIAAHYSDYENTKKAYESLLDLHDKGMFADSNLGSAAPLFVFKATVDSLAPDGQKGE